MERKSSLSAKSQCPCKKSYAKKCKELKPESGPADLQQNFDYTPCTYIFRLSNQILNTNINDQPVRCPPFHILLDHTIGVIWSLFSEQKSPRRLGINQLYWALSFLESIMVDEENRPKDVEHCISTLTEEILDIYSNLLNYMIPKDDDDYEELRKTQKLIVREDIPFSIIYADMISRTPLLDEIDRSSSDTNSSISKSSNADHQPTIFLFDMRKTQMSKVMQELEKLQSIEEYMCNCPDCSSSFKPYMDENDKEINAILAEKKNSQNL